MDKRLVLPSVTLCAATSVNVAATLRAMRYCIDQVEFADAILLTDAVVETDGGIRIVAIEPIRSAHEYSHVILRSLAPHVFSQHCLLVQWDGFLLDATRWDSAFLEYDYIGAPWPQFEPGRNIGNGGFSLRSSKLLNACADPQFSAEHPEDIAIGRTNRALLEREFGIRFADGGIAARFSYERTNPDQPTFGFHGVFNMIPQLGADHFWSIYRGLDDRTTIFANLATLLRQMGTGSRSWRRRMNLIADRLAALMPRPGYGHATSNISARSSDWR